MSLSSKINPIIVFKAQHDFFQSGLLNTWQIRPTKKSRELMRKAGLFFKQELAEVTLGFTEQKTKNFIEISKEIITLDFLISIPNPHFQTFTNCPLFSTFDQYFYFKNWINPSNRGETSSDELNIKPTKSPLHAQSKVTKADLFSKKEFSTLKNIKLTESSLPAQNQVDKDKENERAFAKTFPNYSVSNIGILNLKISKEMLTPQESTLEPYQYFIHFSARETIWRYFFLNPNKDLYQSINILESRQMKTVPITTKNGQYQLSDGSYAWGCILESPRPLQEYYSNTTLEAELIKKTFHVERQLAQVATGNGSISNGRQPASAHFTNKSNNPRIKLPNATEEKTRGEISKQGELKMYSDIYVYI